MLPGIGLVHERMEHAHLFTGGLVRCNRSVKPMCGYLLELHVPDKSRNDLSFATICTKKSLAAA